MVSSLEANAFFVYLPGNDRLLEEPPSPHTPVSEEKKKARLVTANLHFLIASAASQGGKEAVSQRWMQPQAAEINHLSHDLTSKKMITKSRPTTIPTVVRRVAASLP